MYVVNEARQRSSHHHGQRLIVCMIAKHLWSNPTNTRCFGNFAVLQYNASSSFKCCAHSWSRFSILPPFLRDKLHVDFLSELDIHSSSHTQRASHISAASSRPSVPKSIVHILRERPHNINATYYGSNHIGIRSSVWIIGADSMYRATSASISNGAFGDAPMKQMPRFSSSDLCFVRSTDEVRSELILDT